MAKTDNEMKQVADVAGGPVDSGVLKESGRGALDRWGKLPVAAKIVTAPLTIPTRAAVAGKTLKDTLVRGWTSNRATSKKLKKAVDVSRGR